MTLLRNPLRGLGTQAASTVKEQSESSDSVPSSPALEVSSYPESNIGRCASPLPISEIPVAER